MSSIVLILVLVLAAYLIGSIPTAYLVAKSRGMDIRQHGSGNPGATNVFRVVGKAAGIFTFCMDCLKGFLPAQIILWIYPGGHALACAVGFAAILGHNWPVFLNFQGGKGVATSAGVFLAVLPLPTVIGLVVFGLALLSSRHVSVGSMAGAASVPITTWWFTSSVFLTSVTGFCAALIFFMHRNNIRRLLKNEEPAVTFGGKHGSQ